MKRNKLFILGICTVMVALVSLSLVSGTWARYTSKVSGEDSAKVAKWEVVYSTDGESDVKGSTSTETIKFNLFGTLLDTNGSNETDVKETDGTLIAPGTKGSFSFTVTNNSEVTAKCNITFAVENEIAPVKYTFNSNTYETVADLSSAVDAYVSASDMSWEGPEATRTITIGWEWPFGESTAEEAIDTALGLSPVTTKVTATIVFTQVD